MNNALLPRGGADSERWLLLLLIVLLWQNEASPELILALAYIAL